MGRVVCMAMLATEKLVREFLLDSVKGDPTVHLHAVEHAYRRGVPDLEGQVAFLPGGAGGSFWMELKVAPRPRRPTTKVTPGEKLKAAQANFLEDRCRAGGRAWVLLVVGGDACYLIPGRSARLVGAIPEAQLAPWRVPLDPRIILTWAAGGGQTWQYTTC